MKKEKKHRYSRKTLMEAALGRKAPDLLVSGASLLNVWTGKVQENALVAVYGDRIVHVGTTAESGAFKAAARTRVLEARGRVLVPGFIDSHTHLAWLVRPEEYIRHLLPLGTTTVITETMEIYPVAGKQGVDEYLKALENQPLRFYATLPAMAAVTRACLGIDPGDAAEMLAYGAVVGLGETYWQTLFQNPDHFLPVFDMVSRSGKCLEGHSAGAKGRKLSAYAALGISSCHESINSAQVLERLEKGFHVQIREGSIRSDLPAIASIVETGVDLSNISLVSDGITPRDLLCSGHMENIVQKAITCGFRPADAIRMVTLNPARHFRLDHDIGSIAPGRYADMVLIPDLHEIRPETVIAGGKIAARDGKLTLPVNTHDFSPTALSSIKISQETYRENFRVPPPLPGTGADTRVIEFVTDLVTRESICRLPVSGDSVCTDPDQDVLKAVAVDRTHVPGKTFTGFVKGYGMKQGAIATSAAWDGSDIIALGTDDRDLDLAVSRIIRDGGGIVLARGGTIIKSIPLPVFGLLSLMTMEAAGREISDMVKKVQELGCPFHDPLLSLSTLTGAAIPYLRICSEGLVDLKTGRQLSLFPGRHPSHADPG